MSKYKNQQAIDEFREKFVKNVTKQVDTSNSIVLPMWKDNYTHLSRDIEQFLDEQLSKKEEEVLRKFVSFCKHWIRGHKKDDWHPILMDSFEAFLENRKEEFTNWEFEETVRIVELKTQTKK